MKNKKYFFLGLIVWILVFGLFFYKNLAYADSGWDTDYDSGWDSSYDSGWDSSYDSSWDNDYDYDYDYDYGSGTSSSDSSGSYGNHDKDYSSSFKSFSAGDFIKILITVFTPYLLFYLFLMFIVKKVNSRYSKKYNVANTVDDSMYFLDDFVSFKKYMPNEDIEKVKIELLLKFKEIQAAWMEFDYDKLRKLCTDELYNTYKSQLKVLELKDGKNIMTGFVPGKSAIYSVKEVNGIIEIGYYLKISFYDYVIDVNTNEVTRGNKNNKVYNTYIMTFVRNKNKNQDSKCPNCGAELNEHSAKCEYCRSKITAVSGEFILSKKSNLR